MAPSTPTTMRALALAVGPLLLLLPAPAAAQVQAGTARPVSQADRYSALVSHAPAVFGDVPEPVRQQLEGAGCRIPQPPETPGDDSPEQRQRTLGRRANLVRGEFVEKGRALWAAVCSRNGFTSILFVHEEDAWEPIELRASPDAQWLGEVDRRFYFTTQIERVAPDASALRDAYPTLSADELRRPLHDALLVNEVLGGTGQPIYWTGRRWVALPGYH